jgi:5-methylcytosine-specific restriction protein A
VAWAKTSRHSRGYGSQWDKLRIAVLRRDMGLCQPCLANNRTALATEVDHITPKAKGGTDDIGNLQAICRPCHTDKSTAETGKRVRPTIGADGWPVT